jgi:uncharacterized protein
MTFLKGQRSCRACREKKGKRELLRLTILDKKTLEVDPKQISPGRGWYLCPVEPCLSLLKGPKSLQKAFGRGLEIGPHLYKLLIVPPSGGEYGQN